MRRKEKAPRDWLTGKEPRLPREVALQAFGELFHYTFSPSVLLLALYDLAPDFPIGVDERTGDLLEAKALSRSFAG